MGILLSYRSCLAEVVSNLILTNTGNGKRNWKFTKLELKFMFVVLKFLMQFKQPSFVLLKGFRDSKTVATVEEAFPSESKGFIRHEEIWNKVKFLVLEKEISCLDLVPVFIMKMLVFSRIYVLELTLSRKVYSKLLFW